MKYGTLPIHPTLTTEKFHVKNGIIFHHDLQRPHCRHQSFSQDATDPFSRAGWDYARCGADAHAVVVLCFFILAVGRGSMVLLPLPSARSVNPNHCAGNKKLEQK